MIYSGLDWSGSPGEEHGDFVTFAAVHFSQEELGKLPIALACARRNANLRPNYVFKNNGSGQETRSAFFNAIRPLDFSATVHQFNKQAWAEAQTGRPTGPQCILDGVVTLVLACPDEVVSKQVLYVDIDPSQRAEITQMKTAIRQALRAARPRRFGFEDVRGCEDHRKLGSIIQVADLIAGQVRDHNGLDGPFLPLLGRRIVLV